jgi:hypothetical protein
MLFSTLRKAARRRLWTPQIRCARPRTGRFRPCFEVLEERLVPATYTVTDLGDAGAGSDLRSAIEAANANLDLSNRIVFVTGLSGTISLEHGALVISKSLEVDGPGAARLTVSGGHAGGVFGITAGAGQSVLLSDLTIADGTGAGQWQGHAAGGGLFNDAARLGLTRITLTGNAVPAGGLGGGLFNARGTVTLTSGTISGNHADGAGSRDAALANFGTMTLTDSTVSGNAAEGLANSIENSGNMTLNRCLITANRGGILNTGAIQFTTCTISGNASVDGGGVENRGGSVIIDFSTIADNAAEDRGGGVFGSQGELVFHRDTISGNTAVSGGGIYSEQGDLRIQNSTISGNTAERLGGGVHYADGFLEVNESTITLNATTQAGADGGGGGVFAGDSIDLLNTTIVAGNRSAGKGPDFLGPVISLGYNLIGQTDGSSGWRDTDLTGTSDQPLDPRLGPLGDYGGPDQTHALLADSPALGSSDPGQIGAPDQRGTLHSRPDIGAFEAGTAVRFQLVAPSRVDVGSPFQVSVIALDQWGNRASTYTGTIHFSSTDFAALLPGDEAFSAEDLGARTFSVTLRTAGSQRLRAADAALLGDVTVQVGGAGSPLGPLQPQAPTGQMTFVVTSLGDAGEGSGLQGDLRYAVNTANASPDLSSRITFAPELSGTITLTHGPLVVSKALEVDGPGAGLLTVSGGHASGVFDITAAANQTVLLLDLSIAGGTGAGQWQGHTAGGGLFNDAARLALTRVTLTGNAVPAGGLGGGLFNVRGTVTLTSCTVEGNHADEDGADDGALANFGTMTLTDSTVSGNTAWGLAHSIENGGTITFTSCLISRNLGSILNSATLRLTRCTVSDNVAANGAGLENRSGQVNINLSTIANNFAEGRGGGFFMLAGQVAFARTTLSGNTATYGGGLFMEEGELRLNNSTVSGNTAERQGGGIYYAGGILELANVTITLNATTDGEVEGGGGGGMFSSATRDHLRNTIVAANRSVAIGPDILGTMISLGHNLIGQIDGSIGGWRDTDLTGTSDQPLDPRLGPLADNGGPNKTHAPLAGSPALGTGDPTQNGRTDQRGSIRHHSTIGAVEAGDAVRFRVVAPPLVVVGDTFSLTVIAVDEWGNRASTFTGTVHFSSTDFAALLPEDAAFTADDRGSRTFSVRLRTAGSQRIRVIDSEQVTILGETTVQVMDPSTR